MKLFEIYGGTKYDPAPYTITKYSPEDLITWMGNNCGKYLARASKSTIFRGMSANTHFGVIDTNGFNRGSANTRNYYNMWIDNNPMWGEYPKRNKSYICTTTYSYASNYDEVSFIIPADNCKIGICSKEDMWFSFNYLFKVLENSDVTMEEVMTELSRIIRLVFDDATEKEANVNWNAFVKAVENISLDDVKRVINLEHEYHFDLAWGKAMVKLGSDNMYDFLQKTFGPKINGFNLQYAHSADFPSGEREVWVQGKVAVISTEHANSSDALRAFLKSYKISITNRG